jgi:hypothetical protein
VVTTPPPASSPPASSRAGSASQRSAESEHRGPGTAATLGIPPGHLPRPGQCRIWIPGTPPGRQPGPRSRVCAGIAALAPAGSWIVYRPTRDRKVVHIRVVDERRPGIVTRVRFFEVDTGRFIREGSTDESQDEDDHENHGRRGDRPRERPGEPEHPANPGYDRPAEPPHERPAEPASAAASLEIPAGQIPDAGECRVWIPGTPPGRQPRPKTRSCEGIAAAAPAGSWIVYRPGDDRKVVHVRLVDERRAGVVIRVRIFDVETGKLVREENP